VVALADSKDIRCLDHLEVDFYEMLSCNVYLEGNTLCVLE
jgi:hypothetical protein